MHFLVTGATGFIGSNLSLALLKLEHKVTGIDNLSDFYDVNLKKKNLNFKLNKSTSGYSLPKLTTGIVEKV